jgi:hypothetical protein
MATWHDERAKRLRIVAAHLAAARNGLRSSLRGKRPRKAGESGAPVPADPGPRPLPLEGGAEAPLD